MPEPTASPPKDDLGLLEVLQLLIKTKKAKTTADLAKYAGQYGAAEAEQRLRALEAEGIPLALAFDAISVHLRILHHKRSSALVSDAKGKKVGLVLPLPHHLAQLFLPVADVKILHSGDHPHHGPWHDHEDLAVRGTRACRAAAAEMDILVFEAFREDGQLFVDTEAAETLEPRLLPAATRLVAHPRPHKNPQDILYTPNREVAFL